jgi:oligopeptide/dipeptide ABC transporter ATP-binding protein
VFAAPKHPYTRALLEAVPVPDPDHAGGKASLSGEIPSALNPPGGCAFHPRCRHVKDICRAEMPPAKTVNGSLVACHFAGEI